MKLNLLSKLFLFVIACCAMLNCSDEMTLIPENEKVDLNITLVLDQTEKTTKTEVTPSKDEMTVSNWQILVFDSTGTRVDYKYLPTTAGDVAAGTKVTLKGRIGLVTVVAVANATNSLGDLQSFGTYLKFQENAKGFADLIMGRNDERLSQRLIKVGKTEKRLTTTDRNITVRLCQLMARVDFSVQLKDVDLSGNTVTEKIIESSPDIEIKEVCKRGKFFIMNEKDAHVYNVNIVSQYSIFSTDNQENRESDLRSAYLYKYFYFSEYQEADDFYTFYTFENPERNMNIVMKGYYSPSVSYLTYSRQKDPRTGLWLVSQDTDLDGWRFEEAEIGEERMIPDYKDVKVDLSGEDFIKGNLYKVTGHYSTARNALIEWTIASFKEREMIISDFHLN